MGICKSVKSSNPNVNTNSNAVSRSRNNSYSRKASQRLEDVRIDQSVLVGRVAVSPMEIYQVIKLLGEGSYGKVYLVRHKVMKVERAMKEIIKMNEIKKENEQDILNEIEILKRLDHPNIVKIFEIYVQPDRYYIITECLKEGELYEKILKYAPFEEGAVCHMMYQIFSAIFYCHESNVVHRDLKPENILIESINPETNEYNVKIIDFGTAKIFEKKSFEKKVIGSSYYIAPEVLQMNYNEKCDLWSCGVILFILLSGQAPFDGNSDEEIIEKIRIGKYEMKGDIWQRISPAPKDLITKLLVYDPEKRISAREALRHSFFNTYIKKIKYSISETAILNYIKNLQNFQPHFKLQQAVLAFIVHNLPNNEDIKEMNNLFQILDEDGDYKISKEELKKGFKNLLPKENNIDIDEVFYNVDADNNGHIDNEEFMRACINKEKILTDVNLKHAFSYFDKDGSGEITIEELKQVFCGNPKNRIEEDVFKELVAEVDGNGDGVISFEEFKNMMMDIFVRKEPVKQA